MPKQQLSRMPSQEGEQNGLMGRVDEGVDEFFTKKVTKIDKSVLFPLHVYNRKVSLIVTANDL